MELLQDDHLSKDGGKNEYIEATSIKCVSMYWIHLLDEIFTSFFVTRYPARNMFQQIFAPLVLQNFLSCEANS